MVDTPKVELNLGGTWTDVSSYVRYSDRISITRGQHNEGSSSLDASTCSLTLNNSDGRFTPRNPTSPYYGLLGRNTPLRVSLPYGSSYLRVWPDDDASQATAPDVAGLDVIGDLDIRIEVDADHWGEGDLAAKYEIDGDNRSWWFGTDADGAPRLIWSSDGTSGARIGAGPGVSLPSGPARRALRVTLDINNGNGGWTATFYTADTIAGPWTQLGDADTGSGTTSVFDSTAPIEVGSAVGITGDAIPGKYIAFELRNGIDGFSLASPDFSAQAPGTTSFTDAQGNTWTVGAGAAIDDRRYRFHGEVASWPPTRDISGKDATVSIKAAGISRRLKQGERTLQSPMTREFSNPARQNIKAYWPMEDDKEATQIAGGTPGTPPGRIIGSPRLGDYDGWTASNPVPTMATGAIVGTVPRYGSTGQISVRLFVYMPSGGVTTETSLLHLRTTGSAPTWEILLDADGNLRTRCFDFEGTSLLDDWSAFSMNTRGFVILVFELSQDGSDVDWRTRVLDFTNTDTKDDPIFGVSRSGTVVGKTLGVAKTVTVGRDRGLTDVKVGHLAVADDLTAYNNSTGAIAAWNAERPVDRMIRLCNEEEVGFYPVADAALTSTTTMGDQLDKGLLDLLQEAADTDGGILFEPRDSLGFAYRARTSMYNQPPMLTLSCADHELSEALQPVDDDQRTLNDVTVKRVAGSSVRAEQTTGPMSTQPPPEGVGRYDTSVGLSLEHDGQLVDQAGWRLHLGTVDEARYPKVKIHLAHPAFATDADLTTAALAVDVGDRIVITDPSPDLPPDDISLLAIGYSEVLDQFEHVITFVCQPESPWRVWQLDTAGFDRLDTAGCELTADATSTDTELTVGTTSGPVWTTDPGDMPFDVMVAGERCTVTAVTGDFGGASGVHVADAFTRTESSWWGTADSGQEWSAAGGDPTDYTTDGSVAVIEVDTINSGRYATLAQVHTNVDIRVDIRGPTTPTGDATNGYLLARYTNTTNWYAATAGFAEDGKLYVALERVVGGSFAFVVSPTDTGITYDTGTWYTLRFQVIGNALSAKIWERDTDEPSTWAVTSTDSSLTSGTHVGCRAFVEPSSTVTLPVSVLFDNLYAAAIQTLTVTRSVNGVVKAQSAGAAVTIAEPVYIAL